MARSSNGGGHGGGFVVSVCMNADAHGIQCGERSKSGQCKRERFDARNSELYDTPGVWLFARDISEAIAMEAVST